MFLELVQYLKNTHIKLDQYSRYRSFQVYILPKYSLNRLLTTAFSNLILKNLDTKKATIKNTNY